jgi:NitT/TauT family transport system substrate-binding protein
LFWKFVEGMTMRQARLGRRAALSGLAAMTAARSRSARAAEPLTLVTNWYAQAELGGFYSAAATGLYDRHGVPVVIRSGGPQVNTMQMLIGGACDIVIAQPEAVIVPASRGVPVVTIGATYRKCMTGLLVHPDIGNLAQLKGHPILISTEARSTYWPWLKRTFGFADSQAGVYTFNMQPFVHDPAMAIQSFISSEPYEAEQRRIPFRFLLLADFGYPSYTNAIVVSRRVLAERRDELVRFLQASAEGWVQYLYGDAAAADAAIRKDNPAVTLDHLAWSRRRLREVNGLGAKGERVLDMSGEGWARIRESAVASGTIPASAPWKDAYTLDLLERVTTVLPA